MSCKSVANRRHAVRRRCGRLPFPRPLFTLLLYPLRRVDLRARRRLERRGRLHAKLEVGAVLDPSEGCLRGESSFLLPR